MARKSVPTISQEELYPLADEPGREEVHDARLLDLDVEQEPPFLRVQKRVSVRRGSLPRKTVTRLTWAAVALGVVVLCGITVASLYHYGERSWRFRVESSDDIEIGGMQNVTRPQIMEVMGGDIGRNIFFVPLAQRKAQLEQIPWVESASVMRFIPNRLKVEIHERTPVAFARVGSRILLIDEVGTLMELPGKKKYSFPVIVGMNQGEPPSTRAARMKIYNDVIRQLDSGGAHYSQDLSEMDLTDPETSKSWPTIAREKCWSTSAPPIIWNATRCTSPMCRSGSSSSTNWNRSTCATTGRSSSTRICRVQRSSRRFPPRPPKRRWLRA